MGLAQRNADLVDRSQTLKHLAVSLGAPPFEDVTELGAQRGQRPNVLDGKYQLRSDRSAVDKWEIEYFTYQKQSRAFELAERHPGHQSRQPVGSIVDRTLEKGDPPVNIAHAIDFEFGPLQG